MTYRVLLQSAAVKALDRVDRTTKARLLQRFDELAEDPFNPRISKRLQNLEGKRSSRVGGWRIIYQANPSEQTITIFFIEPRGQVYRRL